METNEKDKECSLIPYDELETYLLYDIYIRRSIDIKGVKFIHFIPSGYRMTEDDLVKCYGGFNGVYEMELERLKREGRKRNADKFAKASTRQRMNDLKQVNFDRIAFIQGKDNYHVINLTPEIKLEIRLSKPVIDVMAIKIRK